MIYWLLIEWLDCHTANSKRYSKTEMLYSRNFHLWLHINKLCCSQWKNGHRNNKTKISCHQCMKLLLCERKVTGGGGGGGGVTARVTSQCETMNKTLQEGSANMYTNPGLLKIILLKEKRIAVNLRAHTVVIMPDKHVSMCVIKYNNSTYEIETHGPHTRYVTLRVVHTPGMSGRFPATDLTENR